MSEHAWQRLDGLDPESSSFPARAQVDGESILIFKTGVGFRGVERSCPHLKSTLLDAMLMANGTMLRCARHHYIFKLVDGKGVNCPGYRLRVFEVKTEDGVLHARAIDAPVPAGTDSGGGAAAPTAQ